MTPSAPPLPLALVSQDLISHCTVTVQTGTNSGTSPALPRQEVKTVFSLRFAGAYPLKIKGLKEGGDFVGFELSLSGPDECEQLIRALEHAASELRWQAGRPSEMLLPEPAEPANEREQAEADWYDAELALLALLLFHGTEPVVGGPTVAQYLRSRVGQLPPVATLDSWGRVLSAMDTDQPPTLAWLQTLGLDADLVELLQARDPGPRPGGWLPDARQARGRCEQAVACYAVAGLRVEHLTLLDALEEEPDADERRRLLQQVRAVEGQRVALDGGLSW